MESLIVGYAERTRAPSSGLDFLYHQYFARRLSRSPVKRGDHAKLVERIVTEQQGLSALPDEKLRALSIKLKQELRLTGLRDELVVSGFALIREVSRRTIGMRHYRTQIRAGLVMLDGSVAEMQTGEGKTLAVTLPAALAAMAGVPVHVITVNDYLAHRDAEQMRPVYDFLGLTVGEVINATSPEQRQHAYRCDLAYCSNNEIVFDYLRDRMVLGDRTSPAHLQFEHLYGSRSRLPRLFLNGLRFAIVDEADSVLVDETRTPLILSAPGDVEGRSDVVTQALEIQQILAPDIHFSIDRMQYQVALTQAGQDAIAVEAARLDGVWESARLREQLVRQAIAANHLYLCDKHYVVRDGKVLIVDQHTGRIMPGRTWSEGMHQFVEAKEGCEITPDPSTLARVSYQSFFRRYIALSGMTGTAREVKNELWTVYGLRVATVAARCESKREFLGRKVLPTLQQKWEAVIVAVAEAHDRGVPVLVGTSNVATSEQVSEMLRDAGLQHAVLNAKQDHDEAGIISRAGERGRITVATNMAGRGTDIQLGDSVSEIGGLQVILTEYHDAARIDRQLVGRCARQGDPGSYLVIASMEDPIIGDSGSKPAAIIAALLRHCPAVVTGLLGPWALRRAQASVERKYSRMRQRLLQADDALNSRLAFAGRAE
jgi:preprotein translocase subunit SecA